MDGLDAVRSFEPRPNNLRPAKQGCFGGGNHFCCAVAVVDVFVVAATVLTFRNGLGLFKVDPWQG